MSNRDEEIKNQIDGVLDETTQAIMDEINEKMKQTADTPVEETVEAVEAVAEETVEEVVEEVAETVEEITEEAVEEIAEAEEVVEETLEETAETEEVAEEELPEEETVEEVTQEGSDYDGYEDEDEEEPMTRKERKEAKKAAKEAAKKAKLEEKMEADRLKREDVNRASNGLRGFGLVTIFLFIIVTGLIVFLVWYLMFAPSYVKDNSNHTEFVYPEISENDDASVWETLTPTDYEATPTDADIATETDATESVDDVDAEAAE